MSSLKFIPPIIAHRGANFVAPENTIIAFKEAMELGATWVEFDVTVAACGEAVVIHDDTLDRTTDGMGLVSDYSFAYLQTLDAGSWFGNDFINEKIPRFSDVISWLKTSGLSANIEIKEAGSRNEELVKKVLFDIQMHWQPHMPLPYISSFSSDILALVRKFSPHMQLGLLLHEWSDDALRLANKLNTSSVTLNQRLVTSDRVEAIKQANRFVLSYTVNSLSQAEEFFKLGVDAIFTDNLEEMLRYFSIGL